MTTEYHVEKVEFDDVNQIFCISSPPLVLLISLGDGTACEVTEEMLAGWHARAAGATLIGENDRHIARGIIQQAQEER